MMSLDLGKFETLFDQKLLKERMDFSIKKILIIFILSGFSFKQKTI